MRTWWLSIVVVLATAGAVAAEPRCKPSASVRGDSALVAQIEPLLRERGIAVRTATAEPAFVEGECRRVTAEVTSGSGRIMVTVTDPFGRRTQRTADDAEAAATVIESWARGDLVDPLLAARGVIDVGETSARASVTLPRARPGFLASGGGDVGVSGDGGLWAGARAQACGMVGRFCIGGLARFAADLEQTGDSVELGTSRYAIGVTAIGERPMRRGRFAVSPGVGIGLTAVTATLPAEGEVEQASAFHVRAAIAGALELTHAWSLRIDLAAELAPLARERLGDPDGIDRQLAASPLLQTWFGIAIAYGGP